MPVHVQLLQAKHITVNGVLKSFAPGDWVVVGKQTAREWMDMGHAVDPFAQMRRIDAPQGTVGIMLFGTGSAPDLNVPILRDAEYEFHWEKQLFMDTTAPIRRELIPAGFSLLKQWQMAVPLWDYRKLATTEGNKAEQKRAQEIIHDLRVPLYDTRMIFAKRCHETETLFELWQAEGGGRLAFLTALYRVKPLIRALPVTWTGQWAPTNA